VQEQSNLIRIKRKTIFYFAVILIALVAVTPVLADYIGPNRTVTETVSVCKVFLNECQFVAAKDDWRYKSESSWSCSNEGKPWQAYSSTSRACNASNNGYQYWERNDVTQTVTNTYPPATITGSLQNCTLQNNWCITVPHLSLSGIEPVSGESIIAIEGTLNGQNFACTNANCSIPLNQGRNSFTYWALSSFGDSSTMGTQIPYVDSVLPNITGEFTGIIGSNGWYLGPVSFSSSATDATSGMASFTCTLDGAALGSCNTIPVSGEGLHTLILTARDKAGLARILTQNASIDTQAPALNASISGLLGANTWYTTATLNASASDFSPGSGLSVFEYNFDNSNWSAFPTSGVLPLTEGKHNVNLRALDKAGHTVSSTKSFWLDTTAPQIATDSSGSMGMNNWYTTHLTTTASANDDISGIDQFEYSLDNGSWKTYTEPLTLADGTHQLSFWAQDEAGSVTQVDRTYQVDTRAPQIAGSLSGITGMNGWYTSEVTLSASASDPVPGSGLDTFTYTLDSVGEIPYTEQLNLSNGQHAVQLKAQDRAGLSYSIEQTIQVDTIAPSLKIESTLANWIRDEITFNGSAGDNGSGISAVEVSIDGGQTWQAATGTDSWSYIWNAVDSPNGIYHVNVRAADLAGLVTQETFNIGVDNQAPEISLPDSWFQWDTVTLDIWDHDSGVSETSVEIADPEGRWPKRVLQLDPTQFPLEFKWDRRFADDTVAEAGTYDVKVSAVDNIGNRAEKSASIRVLLDILPPGPTATLQPTHEAATLTPAYTATSISATVVSATPISPIPVLSTPTLSTSTSVASPAATHKATQTAVVSVFGAIEPTSQVTPTPAIIPTPRTTPTQTNALDWLQSVFVPNTNEESITKIESPHASKRSGPAETDNNNVLWGTAATAAVGAAIAYAEEERRKKEEEKARLAALEAAEEERREKAKERHMAKMEEKRAWENYWEEARLEQLQQAVTPSVKIDENAARLEEKKEARSIDLQMAIQGKAEEEQNRQDELSQALAAHYFFAQPPEKETSDEKTNWWEKTKSFVNEKIIQPINTYVYQPYIEPALEKRKEIRTKEVAWINENIYQPHIEPFIEKAKEFIASESASFNEYIKPVTEKISQATTHSIAWLNEKVYQPAVKPAIEWTVKEVSSELETLNEKVYQPYIAPAVAVINEKVYQPYIKPVVDKAKEWRTEYVSWANKNIYEPFIEPVVNDINQYIYQPLVEKATNWWDQYGEWVHGALNAAGFIPGFGAAADLINGLIYLGEGRYVEAAVSALAMIPILGDLGKAGKLSLEVGEKVVEETTEIVVKEAAEEIAEEVVETTVKEAVEEVAEGTLEEAGKTLVNQVAKESAEEAAEDVLKEGGEELVEKTVTGSLEEAAEKTVEKAGQEVAEKEWEHTVLNVAGCIPGMGNVTTGINGVIYLAEGNLLQAGLSAISMVPVVGNLAKASIVAGKTILEIAAEKLAKVAGKEVVETVVKDVSEEIVEDVTKEVAEQTAKQTLKEAGEELVEAATESLQTTESILGEPEENLTENETSEQVNDETIQRVLDETIEGKVIKLPADIAEGLTDESAHELAEKISEELGGKKVWVSAESGSIYVSSPPSEGFALAEQLSKTDLTKSDEVEKILHDVAELTSRGSGDHVVLGPFGSSGTFIQKALDTNGVFWDVGDELWESLENTGVDMFKANDQFLRLHVENGIDRFDVVETNVNKVIDDFDNGAPKNWAKIKYTEKEILDLASMPNIPYQLVNNSWVKTDLANSVE